MADSRDITGKNRKFKGTSGVVMPKGSTAERADTESGEIRFNTTTELMEYYDGVQWKPIDAPPTISSISTNDATGSSTVLNADGSTIYTITITGGNFGIGANVKFIGNTGTEYTAGNINRVSGSSITCTTLSNMGTADDPYDVQVINASGLAALLEDAFSFNAAPEFDNASGSLGSAFNTIEVTGSTLDASATDAEGDTITYTIASGSLPTGLTIGSSTGLITGTPSGNTAGVFTFTVQASTTEGITTRVFSITINDLPSGGTITTSGANRIHTFNSSADFVVPSGFSITSADVLLVAGGASGGGTSSPYGGGGGAGGLIFQQSQTIAAGTYPAVVGAGGTQAAPDNRGTNGVDTTFRGSTAIGGGGGGIQSGSPGTGKAGGSGGGGGYDNGGGAGTAGQGFAGGAGNTSPNGGGGGGGATAVGFTNTPCNGGAGRDLSSTFGSGVGESGVFAGGGGGTNQAGYPQPVGGVGGGGDGKVYNSTGATPGTVNTGGGGGGGGNGENGRAGGSGIVIVRYPI